MSKMSARRESVRRHSRSAPRARIAGLYSDERTVRRPPADERRHRCRGKAGRLPDVVRGRLWRVMRPAWLGQRGRRVRHRSGRTTAKLAAPLRHLSAYGGLWEQRQGPRRRAARQARPTRDRLPSSAHQSSTTPPSTSSLRNFGAVSGAATDQCSQAQLQPIIRRDRNPP